MAKIIFTFSLVLIFQLSNAQDFRGVNWGDSQEEVMKKETLKLKKGKDVRNKLETLNGVQFSKDSTDEEVCYAYSYIFYDNKLVGIKTKASYLVKENSRYAISMLYKKSTLGYKDKYKDKFKEDQNTKDGLYKLSVNATNSKIFVEMKQEAEDFYLLESIMKNKGEIALEEL